MRTESRPRVSETEMFPRDLQTAQTQTWYSDITDETHRVRVFENVIEVQAVIPCQLPPWPIAGKKKKITDFSARSRRNLLKLLGRTRFNQLHFLYFATLTYHNSYPNTSVRAKRDIKVFLQRLVKKHPDINYVWRYEFQRRGAPHFHLILAWPIYVAGPGREKLEKELYSLWSDFLNCGCKHCQKHSVDVRKVTSYRQVRSYVSKYISKNPAPSPTDSPGRFWGHSSNLPCKPYVDVHLNPDSFERLRSLCHKILRSHGEKSYQYAEIVNKSWSFFVLLDNDDRPEVLDAVFQYASETAQNTTYHERLKSQQPYEFL